MKILLDDIGGVYIGDAIFVSAEIDSEGLVTLTVDAPSKLPITSANTFQETRSVFDAFHRAHYVPMISGLVN